MKQASKPTNSKIISEGLSYQVNGDNSLISAYLQAEQREFCAYTEKQISSTDLMEIDHFDPTLKGQAGDNYQNWYLVVAKWNRKKSKKWTDYQPILHPTSPDFNRRIWYEDGIYQYQKDDVEAKNLVSLIELNSYELTKERERFIERMKELNQILGQTQFIVHLENHSDQLHFPTAFESVFGFWVIIR